MVTFVFYGVDGVSAKARARELNTREDRATAIQADSWLSSVPQSEHIEFMPDVAQWHRERIEAVYGVASEPTNTAPAQSPATGLSVKHRGGGRWFVMNGDEIVSGPHSKDEAQRLAG